MSTQNNNFTVENLVAKYREYVNEHCPKTYDVSEWVDKEGKAHFEEFHTPCSPEANAGEQLLIVIYKTIAGDNVQKDIVNALSQFSNAYYPNVLSEDEMAFLCKNYKETVEYLFVHRDEWTAGVKYQLNKISKERERLIKEYVEPDEGSTVFIADTEYCDLAVQFPNCTIKGFTGLGNDEAKTAWALGQIRMWALGIKSEIVSGEGEFEDYSYELPQKGSVDFVILRANTNRYFAQNIFGTECNDINALYDLLKPNGRMIFFSEFMSEMAGADCSNDFVAEKDSRDQLFRLSGKRRTSDTIISSFRHHLAKEKAIETIVSFEDEDYVYGTRKRKNIMLVLSKARVKNVCVKNDNLGISKEIDVENIDGDLLWPGYYLANKPENGIPLSEIVSYSEMLSIHDVLEEEDVTYDVTKDETILSDRAKKILNMFSVVTPADMASDYKDTNLCNANLQDGGLSIYEKLGWIRVLTKPCILLYGRNDKFVVGYVDKIPKQKLVTLLDSNPCLEPMEGIATVDIVPCLEPKEGIDVRYIAALLLKPEIKEQIISVCEGDVDDVILPLVIDKIIVPNHTEKERLSFLVEANYNALVSSQKEMKEKYEREIVELNKKHQGKLDNYQHGMRKPIREIGSAIRRMERYIRENIENVEIKDYLLQRTIHIKNHKESLLEDIERLNEEKTYGEPIVFDIDHCLKSYTNYFGKDIEIRYQNEISKRQIEQYMASQEYNKLETPEKPAALDAKIHELSPIFVDIAEYNFNKIVKRILDNADDHGFSNTTHEKCIVEIDLDWDNDMEKLRIDFRNNGTPLPEGLTKEIYGEYKRYGGKTGKTGIGGYEVADNVIHYGGDFTLFQDKDWAVIRIFLPKSKAYERL